MAFDVTQTNIGSQLLQKLLGTTTGLSNVKVKLTGDGRAFGTFQDDPSGLKSGVVMSTGKVADLDSKNASDGGLSPGGASVPLTFTKLNGLIGGNPAGTAVFRADLSNIGFDINSLTIGDGGVIGGTNERFTGFDLDAIKLSDTLVESAAEVAALPSLAELDVFDFSPLGTTLSPGDQRPPVDPNNPDLFGTVNGNVDNGVATLESFDANSTILPTAQGFVSLGESGQVGFDLTEPLAESDSLYLYIGEVGDNGEVPGGDITVSDRQVSDLNDLSTDFGVSGTANDDIVMEIKFDADNTADQLFFQYAFSSEEFVEFGGQFNDAFSLELNGLNLAALSDGNAVTINNLAPSPIGPFHPDFISNPANTGPASNETRLDGYTQPLTFVGNLVKNATNTLTVRVKDARDGLFDSAVFLKGGTFGTQSPLPPGCDADGSGGHKTIGVSNGTFNVCNFGGVGRGGNPSAQTIAEADTLKFTGEGLIARNMLLTQTGKDLQIAFEGIAEPTVILKNFTLENLDNLLKATGSTVDLGNILFDRQTTIQDSFDVFNVEAQPSKLVNQNSVTFLNDLGNKLNGFDNSSDVINGQGGNDQLSGLSGNDLLRGGVGNDTLTGGVGDDILIGNAGNDRLTGNGDADQFVFRRGDGTDTVTDFNGVGIGIDPSAPTIPGVDNLKFEGEGLTAENLILTQNGGNLEVTFEGINDLKVILEKFKLENIDNLQRSTGATVDLGNILFNGRTQIRDSFDVCNADWEGRVMNPNSVTFLNDYSNTAQGFDNSDDVVNGQGGNDQLDGLGGDDLLRGGAGDDILVGGAGIDALRGNDGADVLEGSTGEDTLIGGSGNDRFKLKVGTGPDTIQDFTDGDDLIQLCNCVSFPELTIAQGTGANASNTLISVTSSNELLAILTGVQSSTITATDFAVA